MKELIVKKEGNNKGCKFFSCDKCKYFKWNTNSYNRTNFKNGSCFRCGRYGCDAVDCDKETDFYGNIIPDQGS